MVHDHMVCRSGSDHDIEANVLAEVSRDGAGADRHLVSITVQRGEVHLTGIVDSYARKWAIARAVGRIHGVKDVRDYIEVRPPDEWRRDDETLEWAARRALEWDARLPVGLRAEVTDAVVRLEGTVDHLAQREAAEDAVRSLIGLRDIANEIRVTPAAARPDLALELEAVIQRRFGSRGRGITIAASAGVVTATGTVPSFAMLDDVERAIGSVAGVQRIDNQLLVA